MKLVINTTATYVVPLSTLMQSLLDVGFSAFADVIVVRGGADEDAMGHRRIADICTIASTERVFVVDMKYESFDYHGLHALWVYRQHPNICSDAYFYVLDTVQFKEGFPNVFANFVAPVVSEHNSTRVVGSKPGRGWCMTTQLPNSNIMIFSADMVDVYRGMYGTKLDKTDAMLIECGHLRRGIRSLTQLAAKRIRTQPRVFIGREDVYDTGIERDTWSYPGFCLVKHILWGRIGDITGLGKGENEVHWFI